MAKIEKTFNGKRFTYLCNGEVYKNSTRDYKYACVATTRQAKGAISEGHEFNEPDNDGVYSDIVIPIKYVHQLQQALRLAGMTEMANNFKI